MTNNTEGLGPAERIIEALLQHTDHMVHNRPGAVVAAPSALLGVRWFQATHKKDNDGNKTVFRVDTQRRRGGKSRQTLTRLGSMNGTNEIRNEGRLVGRYQPAGLFEEVAVWKYRQFASVWKVDNEFAARFASYVYNQPSKDMKVVAAAFMLCQSRRGDPVLENGEIAFFDDDFRDVGEAMCLTYEKGKDGFDPKLLLRVRDVLMLPGVDAINRELGFTRGRHPTLGRWVRMVNKWLAFREDNPKLLESAVKAGWTRSICRLAIAARYKPKTEKFFQILKWKQSQSKDHASRTLAIGETHRGDSWEDKNEVAICALIEKEKPNWKVITSKVPVDVGITRAILACAIENGCLSDKDLVIQSPTIEELGLLEVQSIKERWEQALQRAEDTRARNIARNMKSKAAKEQLETAADGAAQKAVEKAEEITQRKFRIYVIVDISSSMSGAIAEAKNLITRLIPAFPADRLHVCVFNTMGRELHLKTNKDGKLTSASVQQAFRGVNASGGTCYGAGVMSLARHRPEEGEEALFIFIGDEDGEASFAHNVADSGIAPVAFGLIRVVSPNWGRSNGQTVRQTAHVLRIPCFEIEKEMFDDPYAVPQTIANLVASTPVAKRIGRYAEVRPRQSLIDVVLKTELLKKPVWACS